MVVTARIRSDADILCEDMACITIVRLQWQTNDSAHLVLLVIEVLDGLIVEQAVDGARRGLVLEAARGELIIMRSKKRRPGCSFSNETWEGANNTRLSGYCPVEGGMNS